MLDSPSNFFKYLTGSIEVFENFRYIKEYFVVNYFFDNSSLFFCQLGSIFTLLSFNQFITTNILISAFSSIGIFALFDTMCRLYPKVSKQLSWGILFYPTLGIWASGLLKDTVTYAAVGLIFYSTYRFTKKKGIFGNIIIVGLSIYACLNLKPYILYILIPSLLIWVQSRLYTQIKSTTFKIILTPLLISLFTLGGYQFVVKISDEAGKYSLENAETVAKGFHSWHTYLAETRDQSGYTLGEIDFSPTGLLKIAPSAFFVTFYRPHPFEVRNAPTALESTESTLLLLLTIYIIFKVGPKQFISICFRNKDVRSFLLFAVLFGIAVGFTSYNFGALSRYKIPAVPFFTASLAIIYYRGSIVKKLPKKSQ